MLVVHACHHRRQERAAGAHELLDQLTNARLGHHERRRDQHAIARQPPGVNVFRHHIHRDVAVVERRIPAPHLIRIVEALRQQRDVLGRPIRIPVEHQRDRRLGQTAHEPRAVRRQLAAERTHLAVHALVLAPAVRDHRAMVLLEPAARLLELEILHGIRAMRDRLIAFRTHPPGRAQYVALLPVRLVRRRLHEHERPAVAHAAHQIVLERIVGRRGVRERIIVPADHVHLAPPTEIIGTLVGVHEVRGDRMHRVERADRVALGDVGAQQRVGLEPLVVDAAGGQSGALAVQSVADRVRR